MNLYSFCQKTYDDGLRPLTNGVEPSQTQIILMVTMVYNVFVKGLKGDVRGLPSAEALLETQLSSDGAFNKGNIADVIGLVFDVVTDRNRNPKLWFDTACMSGEISHTFTVLYSGSSGQIDTSREGAIGGGSYIDVKATLLRDLSKSYNLFGF